jgi:membrane protease YdiL (CAAX protease family)
MQGKSSRGESWPGEIKSTTSQNSSDDRGSEDVARRRSYFGASTKWGVASGTLWVTLAFFLPQFALLPLADSLRSVPLDRNTKIFLLQGLSQLGALLFLWFVMRRGYNAKPKCIGLDKPSARRLGWALVAFPVYVLTSVVVSEIFAMITRVDMTQAQNIGYVGSSGLGLVLVFVALVCLTPFTEELLFRGFLFNPFHRAFGFWGGAVTVSLLFAVAHGQANVGIDVFVLSMFLCYLREKTGSLWPSILMHALKNLVAFIVLFIIGVK